MMSALLAAILGLVTAPSAWAQIDIPGLEGLAGGPAGPPPVSVQAEFSPPTADRPATLFVTAEILEPFHIFSATQPAGGPERTKIKLHRSPAYRLAGEFVADPPPRTHIDQKVWTGLRIEEHYDRVTWQVPIDLAPDVDVEQLEISGILVTQACDAQICLPLDLPFTATRGPGLPFVAAPPERAPLPEAGPYRAEDSSVVLEARIEPQVVTPGGKAKLVITATPDPKWHIYAVEERDPGVVGKGKPTLVVLEETGGLVVHRATTTDQPLQKPSELPGVGLETYHEGDVSWTVEIDVPADAQAGPHAIRGLIGYQVCRENGCQPPLGVRFESQLQVGEKTAEGPLPLPLSKARYKEASKAAASQEALEFPTAVGENGPATQGAAPAGGSADGAASGSLAQWIYFAFLGGILLNLMPCVLPVIGLKIMSFVEQAGQSRREALLLNLWYSAGIITVFLALATMAVVMGLTWGEQFGDDRFNIALTALVFAMALSLLGVWEIPIPGFAGNSKAHDLSAREGPLGAFLKGVLTTVLATPCTGPFMAAALAWAVSQHALTTFSVFTSVGLGMAFPYLVIGAYPRLIRFIPRPGAWMETFKQLMGFVLLGTVVYLLTFIRMALIVPTAALLIGVAVACWWIARTPLTADLPDKLRAWIIGGLIAGTAALLAFWLPAGAPISSLAAVMEGRFERDAIAFVEDNGGEVQIAEGTRGGHELPWQRFTPQRFESLQADGQTVLVDFTADWCPTCKVLEKTVLNTEAVRAKVDELGVVTLQADFTKRPASIKEMLTRLKSAGVPVVAIFPAGASEPSAIFRGMYTRGQLLAALENAAQLAVRSPPTATAMKTP